MIETVCGKIEKKDLGVALSHEHIFIDLRKVTVDPNKNEKPYYWDKLCLENRWRIYTDPYDLVDNIHYEELDIAVKELKHFKKFGGNSIIDCTLDEIDRNPERLKQASMLSGVNVVMGCGHYIDVAIPDKVRKMSASEIAKEIITDLTVGVDGTGIKAGVIGEIGTSATITDTEFRVLEGAGIASLETGNSIHVHTSLYEENGTVVLERLNKLGVSAEKVCIDHIDVDLREDYIFKLLDKGAYIEFDNFGKEFFIPKRENGVLKGRFAYDYERALMIKKIVDRGYINKVLICNDICLKSQFVSYGGNGFAHALMTVKDMLIDVGLTEKQYESIVIDNVANFLDK